MRVVADWRKVQCKAKGKLRAVFLSRFRQKPPTGSIDIRSNRFYPNKSATMLITDGYYEIRSDLPWIFGDFDGNRAESLQWRKWRSGFLWKRRKDEVKRGFIFSCPTIFYPYKKRYCVCKRLFNYLLFRQTNVTYPFPRAGKYKNINDRGVPKGILTLQKL